MSSTGPPIQYTTYTPTTHQHTTTAATTAATDPSVVPHYPNHYPNVPLTVPLATVPIPGQPTTSTYYSAYSATTSGLGGVTPVGDGIIHHLQLRQTNPAPARPPSPPEPAITPGVAQRTVRRLVQNELIDVGFVSADTQSVERLEVEAIAFVQQLFERAHEYANLANRAGTIPSDLLLACSDFGIEPKELYPFARKRSAQSLATTLTSANPTSLSDSSSATNSSGPAHQHKKTHLKRKSRISPTKLTFSTSRSPSPDLLPSDDESGPPIIPATLRGLPPYFPQLPPKHTYLQTPASPPRKAALPSLEKKLKTASLVQESLKNLLLATEDSTGQEDAELLGHIVNWETGLHSRKRWKVGGGR